MAKKSIFDSILESLEGFEEEADAVIEESLRWTARAAVTDLKKYAPTVTGQLKNNYVVGQYYEGFGSHAINVDNDTEHAIYEEYGHRQEKRWIPGRWENGRFIYDPTAKTGMMLTRKWISGSFRLTNTVEKYEEDVLPKELQRNIKQVLKKRGWD